MTNQITKQNAPNAVAGMILGISSLVFGCFFVGLVLGVVGLVLSNKAQNAYNQSPDKYAGEGMIKAGRITSILGIIFGSIVLVAGIVSMIIVGESFFFFFDLLDI